MSDRPIRGILFDKDGTLFDFAATWAKVIDEILAALTPDPGMQARAALAGGYDQATGSFQPGSVAVAASLEEMAQLWAGILPDRSVAEIEATSNRIASQTTHG